jgi:WD40 repeat protein
MAYDAFISYSHAADQRLAAALERALQAFARPWNKRRALDIFRDEGNLNLSNHLWRSIQQALSKSQYFVYLASPQAAQSPWVAQEVGYWKSHREYDRFIVLWTDGSLSWDTRLADFDPERSDAIPNALRGTFQGEPFYLDMRWTRGETDLTLANERFKKQVVQLAATLRGMAVEDMAGEEAEQYRRTLRVRNLTIAGLATLSVLALLAAGFALIARGAAVRSEERARTEQARAQEAASVADAERKEAEAAKGKAMLSEADAKAQAEEAERQKTIAREQARAATIALARVSTQEGRRMMDAGRTGEALAYFARALRADHESVAATWVSNILANGQIWVPGTPLAHAGAVRAVAFSPDGRRVVTGSFDGTARIWDSVTGSPVGSPLRHDGAISSVTYSPDGTWILTASSDSTARLWDARSGTPLEMTFRHKYSISSATFSPDGRRIVTTSNDSSARVWDVTTGRLIAGPLNHVDSEPIDAAAFSPDGALVVTAGADRTARIWDAATGKPVGSPLRHRSDVYTARFSRDGRQILTASADRTAQLWDVKTGDPVGKPLQHGGFVTTAEFSPDGDHIVTASYDGTARIWHTVTQHPSDPLEHGGIVYAASFSRDGRYVLTASRDGTARVWDATTGLAAGPPLQHRDGLTTAAFSSDGSKIVTASTDMTARVWHAGADPSRILRHSAPVEDAIFSDDGRWVATMSGRTAYLWRPSTDLVHAIFKSTSDTLDVAFTSNGRFVVTSPATSAELKASQRPVDVWETETGRFIRRSTREAERVWTSGLSDGRRVSADGRLAAVFAGSSSVQLTNASNGKPIGRPLYSGNDISSTAFSPDGRYFAIGGTNDTARIWDTRTGEPVGPVLQNQVDDRLQLRISVTVGFSPDGRYIATASDKNYARVWESSSGAPVTPVLRHRYGVYHARFSSDGRRLITASLDRTARIWTLVVGDGTPESAVIVADAAELAGGFRLGETGTVVPLDRQGVEQRQRALREARLTNPELVALIRRLVPDEQGRRR